MEGGRKGGVYGRCRSRGFGGVGATGVGGGGEGPAVPAQGSGAGSEGVEGGAVVGGKIGSSGELYFLFATLNWIICFCS